MQSAVGSGQWSLNRQLTIDQRRDSLLGPRVRMKGLEGNKARGPKGMISSPSFTNLLLHPPVPKIMADEEERRFFWKESSPLEAIRELG